MKVTLLIRDRDIIMQQAKERIDSDGTAYIRSVAEACHIEIDIKEEERIAYLLHETGKYDKAKDSQLGYFVFKNPNYEFSEISKRTSIVQRRVLYITVGLAILTLVAQGVNIWIAKANQERQIDVQKQLDNLRPPTIIIDSVVVHQSGNDQSGEGKVLETSKPK